MEYVSIWAGGWQEGVEVEGRGGAAGTCIDPACDACIS